MSLLNSVNTNPGALIALNQLNATNRELIETQNRISTGFEVATARDNGAIFAIAQNQRSELQAFNAVERSLDRGLATVDVAEAAGTEIASLLSDLREVALEATDATITADARDALIGRFDALVEQITSFVANAEFNGANLLNGDVFTALTNPGGPTVNPITVTGADFNVAGTVVTLDPAADTINDATAAATSLTAIEASIVNVNAALGDLGAAGSRIERQIAFNEVVTAALERGIGSLVDADLAQESARLTALQTRQQLGISALSIANTAPQAILGFFG